MKTFQDLVTILSRFLADLIPLIGTLALLAVLWNAFQFIKAEGKDKAEVRNRMLWGIFGLFVIVSVWGLVGVLSNTFRLDNRTPNIIQF